MRPESGAIRIAIRLRGDWRPIPELHRSLVLFKDALICLSYSAQIWSYRQDSHPQPPSYQPDALLLSYGRFENWRKAQDSNLHTLSRIHCFQDSCR